MERWGFSLRMITGAALGLLISAAACCALWLGLFDRVDAAIYDALFRARGPEQPPKGVIIVGYDQESYDQFGPWPAPPAKQASLIRTLAAAQPLAIGIATPLLPEPLGAADLPRVLAFAAELEQSGLGVAFEQAGVVSVPSPGEYDDAPGLAAAAARLGARARGHGHLDLRTDPDDVVRRVPLRRAHVDTAPLCLAAEVAATALDLSPEEPAVVGGRVLSYGPLRLPVAADGTMLIDYFGPAGSFPSLSYVKVLSDAEAAQACRGKIVLVGVTAPPLVAGCRTPCGAAGQPRMAPVEIQANIVAAMYTSSLLDEPTWRDLLSGLLLLGALFGAALPNLRTTDKTALTIGMVFLTGGMSYSLFAYGGFCLRPAAPAAIIAATYAATIVHELVRANVLINREMQAMLRTAQSPDALEGDADVDAPLLGGMAAICALMSVDACCVALPAYREKGNIIAFRGGERPIARGAYLRRSDTGLGDTLESHRPAVEEYPTDSALRALDIERARQAVYIPLRREDAAPAVLALYQTDGRTPLTRREIGICRAVMEQALVAHGRNEVYAAIRGTRQSFFGPISDENLEQRLAVLSAIRTATDEERAVAEAVLRSVTDGVLMFDLAGRPLTCNPKAVELLEALHQDPAEMDLVSFMRKASGLSRDEAVAAEADLITAGNAWSVEVDVPDSGRTFVLIANRAVGRSGKPIGIVTTISEVTEFKRTARMKDELISIATHELRTPLTSILGYAELLASEHLPDASREKSVQVVLRQANHLSQMIDDFLDVSRIEAGREELSLEAVDMVAAAEQCLRDMEPTAEAKQIQTKVVHTDGVGTALADRTKMDRVLSNLVSNAIKYSPEGAAIVVRVRKHNGFIETAVEDTGYGIPKQEVEHVFEKFYRVRDKRTREVRGTGLGLSLVKLIVESHGGQIQVASEVGRGSTFTFTIPAAEAASPAWGRDDAATAEPAGEPATPVEAAK